jgi:hypothetical protein
MGKSALNLCRVLVPVSVAEAAVRATAFTVAVVSPALEEANVIWLLTANFDSSDRKSVV